MIRAALRDGGVAASEVGLIEAHGTGTSLGDPIEMGALRDVFASGRDGSDPLWVGSVKTNIGHAEGAAGIAGLIKLVLSLRHRCIPAHLHLDQASGGGPSELIDWASGALAVPLSTRRFEPRGGRWIAGVSSFGFSGTNAHVVLEAAPEPEPGVRAELQPGVSRPGLYVVSGRSEAALLASVSRHAEFLSASAASWSSLCHTSGAGRSHFAHRAAVVAGSAAEASRRLRSHSVRQGRLASGARPRLAFLFTGQGSVLAGMGLSLLSRNAAFASVVEASEALLAGALRRPLREVLAGADDLLSRTDHAQPALYVVQCALLAMWRDWGVEPALVLGHSVGEYAAAHAAGVFDFATGLGLLVARGRLMQSLPAGGGMLSLGMAAAAASALAADETLVSLAAENGPGASVLSGPVAALERVLRRVPASVPQHWLEVSHGFHSPLMAPVTASFGAAFAGVALSPPRLGMVSTANPELAGAGLAGAELARPDYWVRQVQAPVRFASGMASLVASGATGFVEIGPRPVLLGLGRRCVDAHEHYAWAASLHGGTSHASGPHASGPQDANDEQHMLENLATLHLHGVPIAWHNLHRNTPTTQLPTYPWQKTRMLVPAATGRVRDAIGDAMTPRRIDSPLPQAVFETRIDARTPAFLASHRVDGDVVAPLTVLLELILRCASTLGASALRSLEVGSRLALLPDQQAQVQIIFEPPASGVRAVSLHSRVAGGNWLLHARGMVAGAPPDEPPPDEQRQGWSVPEWSRPECPDALDMAGFRDAVARSGIALQPPFDSVRQVWRGAGASVGEIAAPLGTPGCVLLDACLQVAFALLPQGGETWLPAGLEGVHLDRPVPEAAWSSIRLLRQDAGACRFGVAIHDADGVPVGGIDAVEFRPQAAPDELDGLLYRTKWVERPWQPPSQPGVASFCFPRAAASLAASLDGVEAAAYAEALAAVEVLAASYVRAALAAMGWNALPAGSAASWADRLGVVPARAALFRHLLRLTGLNEGVPRALEVADPEPERRRLVVLHPAMRIELTLLGRCGPSLPGVLRGHLDPLTLLFPGGDDSDALALYAGSPWSRALNQALAGAVGDLVAWRGDKPIRVLEIGGGTGAATAMLLPLLPAGSEYVFTDVSRRFTREAETRFGGIVARTLDLERDPVAQGFAPGSFDLLVAANVMHATAELRVSLRHVACLLAPDGVLAMIEATGSLAWGDLTFGLTDGWWRFIDRDIRRTTRCSRCKAGETCCARRASPRSRPSIRPSMRMAGSSTRR